MKASKAIWMLMFMAWMPCALHGQNIDQIKNADPLVITGAVGTQNTYHYSSGTRYSSPLNNTIYANLNISIYGFAMPFSLYYTNNNLDFNYPQISFNLTPSYKNWTGYIGESSMSMSSYVMNMSFSGVGIEYNDGKRWRGGIFYGRLRKAINDDPTDPFARTPQYKRVGWGFKAGYGTGKNYLDLYMLYAYDCLNSLDERWRTRISPQNDVVVGVKGCVTPFSWMNFTANAATSVFNRDTRAERVAVEGSFDKVFDVRYSTLMRFAGDANMNLSFSGFNTSLSYRFIQPDYTSLGNYYMSNNYHSLGVTTNGTLFRKLSLSATFNGQADNLTKEQMYTTKGFIYGSTAAIRIGEHLSLAAGYNGYLQCQGDGLCVVNDTTEVRRVMNSLNFTPSYSYDTETLGHSASISASYTENKDLNRFATGESDVKTTAFGASYGMDIHPWELNVGVSLSHQQSDGYKTRYTSEVGSLTLSRSFLQEKNLSVSLTGTMAYNEVRRQSKNLSMGGSFSLGYTLAKVHVFSASGSFNKFGDVNITKTRSNLDMTDISVSLNYAYTFSLLTIKSKAHKQQDAEKREKEMREKVEKALKE
ncbi:MAG: hypothetical protein K5945_10030 [Bacteroidaceae bacterium]|nr:hypothetical protein [Bacteroidaceae bacterium]